jgi:hypothetical protein
VNSNFLGTLSAHSSFILSSFIPIRNDSSYPLGVYNSQKTPDEKNRRNSGKSNVSISVPLSNKVLMTQTEAETAVTVMATAEGNVTHICLIQRTKQPAMGAGPQGSRGAK